MTLQTISVKKGIEGSRKCFIVECRPADGNNRNKLGWSKSFDCDEDAEAEANALSFACSTECFAEFRRFLSGNKDEGLSDSSTSVSAGSGGNSNRRNMRGNATGRSRSSVVSRTTSRRRVRTMFVCVRRNGLNGLRFVAAVGETRAGLLRSVSFRVNESVEEAIKKAVEFLRGGTGSRSRDGRHRGDAVFNSRKMASCRCCGGQLGKSNNDALLDDTQVFEDTICLACQNVEKEIVVIRMDEQGLYSEMSLKDICNDSKQREMVAEERVCCICGCEDNEDHEAMIHPCTCNGGLVVAHPSCVDASRATSRFCSRQAGTSCKVCGGNGTLSNGRLLFDTQTGTGEAGDEFSKLPAPNLSFTKTVTATNSDGRALKRARKQLLSNESMGKKRSPSNSVKEDSGGQVVSTPEKDDMSISESEKVGQKSLTRRFNDAVTSVPIKKRKFNLVCSPSPPRSPSPEIAKPKTFCEVSSPERPHVNLNGHGEQYILDGMAITGECPQQDFGGTIKNEIQSTEMCINGNSIRAKVVSSADFSGISMLAAAACISDLGNSVNNVEDIGARAQFQPSESVKDGMEIPRGEEVATGLQIHEKDCEDQTHVTPKIYQASELEDKRHTGDEVEKYISLGERDVGLAVNDEVGQPMDLELVGNNISRGPEISGLANDGNAIGSCPVKLSENRRNKSGKLSRLDSGYLNDDRSHWDLNTVMDKWENPPEDLIGATRTESFSNIPGRSLNNNDIGYSEDIQLQVAVAEWKGDIRSLEQDIVRKGDGKNVHQPKILEQFSLFDKHVDSNISLGFHIDAAFKHQSVHDEVLANRDSLPTSVAKSDGFGSENRLNLSIALSHGISDSAKDIYTESEIGRQVGRQETSNASQVSEMHLQAPADGHLTLIPEIDASCKVAQGIALVKDSIKVSNETSKENHCGYKEAFSSHKHDLGHVKHEIEVCDGNEVQKDGTVSDSPCNTNDSGPNVDVSPSSFEMTNIKVVHTTFPVVEGFRSVEATLAVNDNFCHDDEPGSKDESLGMVEEPMAIDESVSTVDTPVRLDLNVCKGGVSILNTQIDDKVHDIVAVRESASKVDAPVTVNESVCIVNDTFAGYESACKAESIEAVEEREVNIGFPATIDESACNVEDTVAISQGVYMVDCHVAVDQSVCKLDALAAVDACTNIGTSKGQEEALEECSVEMVSEVASDDVYEEDDEPVSYTGRMMDGQADDDSQYEDGEYRDQNSCYWDEDIAEEMEAERVDYGYSDGRDADELGASDERVSTSLQAESKCKGEGPTDTENVEPEMNRNDAQEGERSENCIDNNQVLQDGQFAEAVQVSSYEQGNNKANASALDRSEIESDSKSIEIFGQDSQTAMEVRQHCSMDSHEPPELRKVKNPTSSRQKFSGWDQLPEGFTTAEEALKSVEENIAKRGQGFGWAGPSQRCFLGQIGSIEAMQMDRARYFASGRDGVYLARIRDDGLDTSPRFPSRGTGRVRTAGRGRSLHGMRSRGRGDSWMGPTNGQWGSSRHHSPNYYASPTGYGPLGHTNAAAVAAAKVESNGFVVAPDGTIVKASSSGLTARGEMCPLTGTGRGSHGKIMGKGSLVDGGNTMFGLQKGMEPGRDTSVSPDRRLTMGRGRDRGRGRAGFGSAAIGPLRRGGPERYGRALFGAHGGLDPSMVDSHRPIQSVDYRVVRRDRSLSPPLRRRSPTLRSSLSYRSRSPSKSSSRSRTRSPRMWSSPRGRTFSGIDGGSGSRRRSRSPNIRTETRPERLKSPSHRVGISRHTMSSLPSSRNQRSSPQTTKWSSDRRDTEHIRDYDSKRHSIPTRSSPRRLSPRNINRSGWLDSTGRSKHCEYLRPLHSGRSAEFGSDSRRARREENDVKWKSYGNGVVHSARTVDGGSDIRHLRNEEDGLKAHNSRSKEAADLQARGSPRAGDKDIASRAGSASRRERSREDDKADMKYSRDGRSRGSIKSSGTRELDDDVAPRRRRPS